MSTLSLLHPIIHATRLYQSWSSCCCLAAVKQPREACLPAVHLALQQQPAEHDSLLLPQAATRPVIANKETEHKGRPFRKLSLSWKKKSPERCATYLSQWARCVQVFYPDGDDGTAATCQAWHGDVMDVLSHDPQGAGGGGEEAVQADPYGCGGLWERFVVGWQPRPHTQVRTSASWLHFLPLCFLLCFEVVGRSASHVAHLGLADMSGN